MFVKICLYKPKTIKSWVAGLEEITLIWLRSAFHTFSHGTVNKLGYCSVVQESGRQLSTFGR